MIFVRFVYSFVRRIARKAGFPFFSESVVQVGDDAVAFAALQAARRRRRQSRFAANEQIASGWIAGAELTSAVEEAGIGALSVALAVVDGAAAGEKRGHEQNA